MFIQPRENKKVNNNLLFSLNECVCKNLYPILIIFFKNSLIWKTEWMFDELFTYIPSV